MKNKPVVLVVALVAVSGLFIVFSKQDSQDRSGVDSTSSANQPVATNQQIENVNEQEQSQSEQASRQNGLGYIEFSEQKLADSSDSSRVLFFHAPWCSVCNFYEGQIEEQGVPKDVTILKIDYDSEDELKEKYNVTTQSTFVLLDSEGNIENTWPFARGLNGIQDLYNQI
jgi:thioredoxin-related protein